MDEQQNEHQQVVDDSIEEKNTISNGNGNGSIKLPRWVAYAIGALLLQLGIGIFLVGQFYERMDALDKNSEIHAKQIEINTTRLSLLEQHEVEQDRRITTTETNLAEHNSINERLGTIEKKIR